MGAGIRRISRVWPWLARCGGGRRVYVTDDAPTYPQRGRAGCAGNAPNAQPAEAELVLAAPTPKAIDVTITGLRPDTVQVRMP